MVSRGYHSTVALSPRRSNPNERDTHHAIPIPVRHAAILSDWPQIQRLTGPPCSNEREHEAVTTGGASRARRLLDNFWLGMELIP